MRSCDTCPGGAACAGDNLAPVLAEVYELFREGVTDKFDILFSLSAQSEDLFERYNDQVSRICWTKAALKVIADNLASTRYPGETEAAHGHARDLLSNAVNAFANFPWHVSGLIGQAPDLHDAIAFENPGNALTASMSRRRFVKMCKEVVYRAESAGEEE